MALKLNDAHQECFDKVIHPYQHDMINSLLAHGTGVCRVNMTQGRLETDVWKLSSLTEHEMPGHEEYLKQYMGDFTLLDSFEAMMPPQRDWFSLGMQTGKTEINHRLMSRWPPHNHLAEAMYGKQPKLERHYAP